MAKIPSPNDIAVALRAAYEAKNESAFNFALRVAAGKSWMPSTAAI
jgi:hypothetical protein